MFERESLQRRQFSIRHSASAVWETDAGAAGENRAADDAAVPGGVGCAVESFARGIVVGGVDGDGGEDFVGGEVGLLGGAQLLRVVVGVLGHVGEGFSWAVGGVRVNFIVKKIGKKEKTLKGYESRNKHTKMQE